MTLNDLNRLKDLLLRQRQEIFQACQDLKKDWEELSEREIEKEEEAQKADRAKLFAQLNERELQEIEEIDLALTKIASATYGICEGCRKTIPLKRLLAMPATRYCLACSESLEEKGKLPPAIA